MADNNRPEFIQNGVLHLFTVECPIGAFCVGVSVPFTLALFTGPSAPATHVMERREYSFL